ncbi:uncharacterized protein V6R79_026066 [Siganus canaliculatus]
MNAMRKEETGEEATKTDDHQRRLRFTQIRDRSGCTSEQLSSKESSIAVVLPQKPVEQKERLDLFPPTREKVEVIKVFLEARPQSAGESVRMLTDEVSQIQEVRYCLKTLREQMAARQNNNNNKVEDNQDESARLREATKRLYAQMKEMEKRHEEERERLQAESNEYGFCLAEQSERLQKAEELTEEKGQQVEELQRLLESMEMENSVLKEKMAAGEVELQLLKAGREEGGEKEQRCIELEKEVAILKEKIHHLDDMLKSQQRKVRHMIEQLQNSRTVMQERDRVIRDLEEKVAFLEAENREMHDHMEYFLAGQDPPPLTPSENKPEIVYSKPITPTTPTNKTLPFIKVIEIKS